jgi:hypothetical protein
MKTHAAKSPRNKRRAVAHDVTLQRTVGAPGFQLLDSRPEAVVQGKWQELADNSARATQLRAFQEMAGNGRRPAAPSPAAATFQLRNSPVPNWRQEYLRQPGIHAQGIAPYIQHVEQGELVGGAQQGVHVMPNGNPPANVTVVEQANIGWNSIGKILWHFTNAPRANGTAAQPIEVKNSTVFPTRLSQNVGGTTGVRALMKAAASGAAFGQIAGAAGLTGAVAHAAPSVYPTGSRLRAPGTNFNVGGTHYQVLP